MAIRAGLLKEVVVMAFDTLRGNKMRSALTVLGVVIGITSIVGMTSLIRGFDQSLRDMIGAHRAEHDLRRQVRAHQLRRRRGVPRPDASGPNLTIADAQAIEEQARDDRQSSTSTIGAGARRRRGAGCYAISATRPMAVISATSEHLAEAAPQIRW